MTGIIQNTFQALSLPPDVLEKGHDLVQTRGFVRVKLWKNTPFI